MSHRFIVRQESVANFIQPLPVGDITSFCRLGCSANFWPATNDGSEETKACCNRLRQFIDSKRGLQSEGFYLYLKVQNVMTNDGSVRARLFGSVHGQIFKDIYEELELLEPVQLKLDISFGRPLDTRVITEEMSLLTTPKDKQVPMTFATFEQDMALPWPSTSCESGIYCHLTSELIFSPYIQPGNHSPKNGSFQIAEMTKQILESGFYSDFILKTGNGDHRLPCHKVFLTPSSQFFATMFKTDMMESKMNECRLDGSTKEGVSALLKFVYYQDIQDPLASSTLCVELLHLALMYDIPTLAHWLRDTMLSKPNGCNWWDIESAVSLYFRVRFESDYECLKEKAIQILKTKRAKGELMSNTNSHFQDLCSGDPTALKELIQLMFCSI